MGPLLLISNAAQNGSDACPKSHSSEWESQNEFLDSTSRKLCSVWRMDLRGWKGEGAVKSAHTPSICGRGGAHWKSQH